MEKRIKEVKRKEDTKRKITKGGVFEAFEKEITGKAEHITSDEVYEFLKYIFADERNKSKLLEISDKKMQNNKSLTETIEIGMTDNNEIDT